MGGLLCSTLAWSFLASLIEVLPASCRSDCVSVNFYSAPTGGNRWLAGRPLAGPVLANTKFTYRIVPVMVESSEGFERIFVTSKMDHSKLPASLPLGYLDRSRFALLNAIPEPPSLLSNPQTAGLQEFCNKTSAFQASH